jgi:hypothetical protein
MVPGGSETKTEPIGLIKKGKPPEPVFQPGVPESRTDGLTFLEGVPTLRPYFRVGSVVVVSLLCQTWMAETNQAQAQKKPPSVHLPNASGHANVNHKDIEFTVSDDVKVRWKYPPIQYDEKGKPRKATAAELTQLKGSDPKQPGYSADVFDLKPGQIVQLQLWKQKDDSKADDNKKPDPKNADNAAKPGWVSAGTLTGTLKAYKSSGKKSSAKKLTVTIDTTTMSGQHQRTPTNSKGKITMPDVEVTFVMILSQDQPAKDAPAKKNN